jgi:thiamine transporter ThiT
MVVDKIVQPEQCHLLLRSKQVLSFDSSGKYGFDGLAVVLYSNSIGGTHLFTEALVPFFVFFISFHHYY